MTVKVVLDVIQCKIIHYINIDLTMLILLKRHDNIMYSNWFSTDFLNLLRILKNNWVPLFPLDHKTIEGLNVTGAKKDLSCIYSKTSIKEEAFKSYIKSVIGNHSKESDKLTSNRVQIKREMSPTIGIQHIKDENITYCNWYSTDFFNLLRKLKNN